MYSRTRSILMHLIFIFIVIVSAQNNTQDGVIVQVEQGLLRGEVLTVVTGNTKYVSYKGIPYARPPVGNLRFMPPKPPTTWRGIRNATNHGPDCMQKTPSANQSEDCLYLNVYTPNTKPAKLLPVMFFIHGGGFQNGSGNSARYGPDYLIEENIVLVTINYRLNIFGFLYLNIEEAPGNAGLKDQVAAMTWVRRNIVNFGGDPENVTIFGQNAGGVSVALHTLSPMTQGLYKRGAAMSGVPFNDWALPYDLRRHAFQVGQQLGFTTGNANNLFNFLQRVRAEQLIAASPTILLYGVPKVNIRQSYFTPVVEDENGTKPFITIDAYQALKQRKVRNGDFMIGHTSLEGLSELYFRGALLLPLYASSQDLLVPRKISYQAPRSTIPILAANIRNHYFGPISFIVIKEFIQYVSDATFNYDIMRYARLFPRVGRIYNYVFSILTNLTQYVSYNEEYGITGAAHGDDLVYLFYPEASNIKISRDSEEYKLIRRHCRLFSNFARYGNPTPDNSFGVQWPQYNNVTEYYLDIGNNLTVGQHLDNSTLSYWQSVYRFAGVPFY